MGDNMSQLIKITKTLLLTGALASFSINLLAKDPTKPLYFKPKAAPKQTQPTNIKQPLTGIIKKGNQYFAVLEGKLYKKGDYYRDSRIVKITRSSVRLNNDKGSRVLSLFAKLRSQ